MTTSSAITVSTMDESFSSMVILDAPTDDYPSYEYEECSAVTDRSDDDDFLDYIDYPEDDSDTSEEETDSLCCDIECSDDVSDDQEDVDTLREKRTNDCGSGPGSGPRLLSHTAPSSEHMYINRSSSKVQHCCGRCQRSKALENVCQTNSHEVHGRHTVPQSAAFGVH